MKWWSVLIWIGVCSLLAIMIVPSLAYAGFGQGNEFGSDGFNGGFAPDPERSRYFIHDTLIKFIVVLVFSGVAVAVLFIKRSFRKVLLIASVGVLGFVLGGLLCPFMSVQNIFLRYQTGYLLLFLVPTGLALVLGRVYCGSVCPFGAIQELIHLSRYRIIISLRLLRVLNKIKYVILGYLVIRILVTNVPVLVGSTPFNPLFSLGGSALALVLTGITAVLSLFVYRPFCQIGCPLGAWLGICSLANKWTILPAHCRKCNRCSSECGMQAISRGRINTMECIVCSRCADQCPFPGKKPGTVSLYQNSSRGSCFFALPGQSLPGILDTC